MDSLVRIWRVLEVVEDLLGSCRHTPWQLAACRLLLGVSLVDEQTLFLLNTSHLGRTSALLFWWASGKVQMHISRLQKMHRHLIHIRDRANKMTPHMTLIIEALHATKHSAIASLFQSLHLWVWWRLGVEPLLDFNEAGAVVQLVGCVCGLLCKAADLADEGHLLDFGAVDGEFGVGVWLLGVDKLLDCDWAETVFAVALDATLETIKPHLIDM